MSNRAIFFDRDGVVNRRLADDYVKNVGELELLPAVAEVLARAHGDGFLTVVVTNQRGVARGLMTERDVADIHAVMQQRLEQLGGSRFDAIYHCPHGIDDNCPCRKPKPGLLLQAAREHDIDLSRSWMIGDTESDIEAGAAAGCRTALLAPRTTQSRADFVAPDLLEIYEAVANI